MQNDSDRGCGYCVFVDESRSDDKRHEEIQKLEAKLKEKEEEIRRLQSMNGILECVIEFKNAEIEKLSKKLISLLICLGVLIFVTIMMLLSG